MSKSLPFPAEGWPQVAAALPKPWPPGAAEFDVRWYLATTGERPGRRHFCDRWGWTEHAVRTLLQDTDAGRLR